MQAVVEGPFFPTSPVGVNIGMIYTRGSYGDLLGIIIRVHVPT